MTDWWGDNWLDLVGWLGSALLIYSLLQARVLRFRILNLTASVVLLTFNALIHVWPMVGMNAVTAGINVWWLARLLRERHDDTAFDVIEVDGHDAYLRHFIEVHRHDISKVQPEVEWDPTDPRDRSFLVLKGDETVGVVLLRAEGEVARLHLDYVTPRFRDFTPGEFVWRRSGLLRENGFARVITPEGMENAYYDHIGFRREGTTYVLDL